MSMMTRVWRAEDVHGPEAFCEYAEQMLGIPFPTTRDKVLLKTKAEEIMARYPQMNWRIFCRVVDYLRSRNKRPPRMWMVIEHFREAWSAGQIPELDPRDREDEGLERLISAALEVESDDYWRRRLIGSRGPEARRRTFEAWLMTSSNFV